MTNVSGTPTGIVPGEADLRVCVNAPQIAKPAAQVTITKMLASAGMSQGRRLAPVSRGDGAGRGVERSSVSSATRTASRVAQAAKKVRASNPHLAPTRGGLAIRAVD